MPQESLGTLLFVLHSHLPYVLYHGRWPHGTDWLCEAAAESYIPLLDELNYLKNKGIKGHITIGITPVLAEQMAHPEFKREFVAWVQEKLEASREDEAHFRESGEFDLAALTGYWRDWFGSVLDRFNTVYNQDILAGFRQLQDDGIIEIITSCATHGYMPLLGYDSTCQAQVKQGVSTYEKHFGCRPTGFWLPECAYRPSYRWSYPVQPSGQRLEPYVRKGVEEYLAENGLKAFFIENHLLLGGSPTEDVYSDRFASLPVESPILPAGSGDARDVYRPHWVQSSSQAGRVAVFARDDRTGGQVWSAAQGYPGDPNYLDFHKKRLPGAHRYWRVTGPDIDMGDKQRYIPEVAAERVKDHAAHFVNVVKGVLREHYDETGKCGMICAPYDTELFGHWWFEGVSWLGAVLEALASSPEVSLGTVSRYLDDNPPSDTVRLPEGSWGQGGFHHVWLNEETAWTWQLVYEAEARMNYLASTFSGRADLQPLLKQCAREMLLLSSSDWQFNISTGTSKDYGQDRLKEHFDTFQRLAGMVERTARGEEISPEEWGFLAYAEQHDSLFDNIDPSWFGKLENPVPDNSPATLAT